MDYKYFGITAFISGFWYKFSFVTFTILHTPILYSLEFIEPNPWCSRPFRVTIVYKHKKNTLLAMYWTQGPSVDGFCHDHLKTSETTTTLPHFSIAIRSTAREKTYNISELLWNIKLKKWHENEWFMSFNLHSTNIVVKSNT